MKRRQLLSVSAGLAATGLLAHWPAHAQSDRPIRVLVGFPAGVAVDVVSRIVADKLREELGRAVIVENRPGAGGRLAAEVLKNMPPDGTTVMIAPIVVPVLAPLVFSKLKYDPVIDFTPVGHICDFDFALAVPADSPAKSLKDYAAWLKANPQQANFGSPAAGSQPHFFGVMIGDALGVPMVHVPFNGGAALQSAVLGNHVPAGIDVVFEWSQNASVGKVRVLGTSGTSRNPVMPHVPTFSEQGYPQVVGKSWMAMYAPPKTPGHVIETFNRALNKVLALPDVKRRFMALGLEVGGGSPGDLARTMQEDTRTWTPIVKKSGFKAD